MDDIKRQQHEQEQSLFKPKFVIKPFSPRRQANSVKHNYDNVSL